MGTGRVTMFNIQLVAGIFLLTGVPVRGQLDKAFCDRYAPSGSGQKIPMPSFPKDFQVVTEQTLINAKTVSNIVQLYSETQQMVYVDDQTPSNETILYILPEQDQYLVTIREPGEGGACTSGNLDGQGNRLSQLFNIKKVDGKYTLPKVNFVGSFTRSLPTYYQGDDTVRGIPAQRWNTCGYQAPSGKTVAIDFYFSSQYTMPGSSTPVILGMKTTTKTKGQSGHNPSFQWMDFTHYRNKVTEKYPFMIPKQMWCKHRPQATNLPIPPVMFQFQSEQTNVGNINQVIPSKPFLSYYKQSFLEPLKMYEMDTETGGDDVLSKFRHQMFHDFNTGLQFKMDVTVGSCSQSPISVGEDYMATGINNVRIRTPSEFFDLEGGQYQYMGEHKDMDRGIDCDVFTEVIVNGTKDKPLKTMYTWYFASKNWMTKKMHMDSYWFLPVRVIIDTSGVVSDVLYYDIYRFTDKPYEVSGFPNLSPCYDVGQELYIDILLKGRYDYIYLAGAHSFLTEFKSSLTKYTSVFSLYRITDITVEPSDKLDTVVSFTLLEAAAPMGNVDKAAKQISNDVIYRQLQNAVRSKKFVFNTKNNFGDYKVSAIAVKQRLFKPASKPTTSTISPNTSPVSSGSKSSGYSKGAMGGLACGMLVLGVIIGFVAYKLIRRRIIRTDDSDIPMTPYKQHSDQ